jgi:hypothetical protein
MWIETPFNDATQWLFAKFSVLESSGELVNV